MGSVFALHKATHIGSPASQTVPQALAEVIFHSVKELTSIDYASLIIILVMIYDKHLIILYSCFYKVLRGRAAHILGICFPT